MIPYSYNMVDMGGIDLAEANGTVVPGVYEKIVEAMNLCGDVILYNWKFAGINVAPSAYTILQQVDSILINGLIQVTELDQITVIGLPPPPVPVAPLSVTLNGTYEAIAPQSGFNPVTVDVPAPVPVISSISISENGTYTAPEGVDGYSPITVDVQGGSVIGILSLVDNKNVTSATGQTASITTEEDYSAVAIVAFTVNTGTVLAPSLSISGGIQLVQDQNVSGFYYGRPYFILAHAFDVPSGTTISATSPSNSASATLFLFGISGGGGGSADLG